MKVWVFTISHNEGKMMPFFLRHYAPWCEKIFVFDDKSTDGTRALVEACPKAELRDWPWKTGLDDEKFREAISTWYREAHGQADWILWPDVDELLWHPEPFKMLAETKADMIGATGYALMSPTGWPQDDGKSQLYDLVPTGVRQENYDKFICWRPSVSVQVAHGRHTYKDEWPKCSGVIDREPKFKLFHCHHVGGVADTKARNERNYERAHEKKYAWNMTAEHDKAEQNGSLKWVEASLKKLTNVVGDSKMNLTRPQTGKRIQFGSGGLSLPTPWENTDIHSCDITKPLPYANESASFLVASHCIEHVTPQQAWRFLEECHRILKVGGVVRIAFPDLARLAEKMTPDYAKAVKDGGHGDSPLRACVFSHGHAGAWTVELMSVVMEAIGFKAASCAYGESVHNELTNVDQHGKTVGEEIARVETSICEGMKN